MLTMTELQAMSFKQLSDLSTNVETAKLIARKRELESIAAAAKCVGLTLDDLMKGIAKRPWPGRKIATKYFNPKAPSQTWAGRGRRPKWGSKPSSGRASRLSTF